MSSYNNNHNNHNKNNDENIHIFSRGNLFLLTTEHVSDSFSDDNYKCDSSNENLRNVLHAIFSRAQVCYGMFISLVMCIMPFLPNVFTVVEIFRHPDPATTFLAMIVGVSTALCARSIVVHQMR